MERMTHLSLKEFCHSVGSDSFSPGGGCVSALGGALGASLAKMVLSLTIGKKKYLDFDAENKELLLQIEEIQHGLLDCINKDFEGCNWIMEALALPKDTEPDKLRRKGALSDAYKKANEAPLVVCEKSLKLLNLFKQSLGKVNRNAITDWACGALQAYSALEGASMNAKINCSGIDDPRYCKEVQEKFHVMLGEGRRLVEEIRNHVHSSIDSSN